MKVQTKREPQNIKNSQKNKLFRSDSEFHDWYRFVLSFPPHLVRQYINEFELTDKDVVLDPFCGTGTTLVEAKKLNLQSVGIEANNFAFFASSVKTDWSPNPKVLRQIADLIFAKTNQILDTHGVPDSPIADTQPNVMLRKLHTNQERILLKDSISPIPLHKAITLFDEINGYRDTEFYNHLALAFGNSIVFKSSNLRFGPEVGIGKIKLDTPVVAHWFEQISKICDDLESAESLHSGNSEPLFSDSRNLTKLLKGRQISAVVTSPPYPNEKDYTRTTRLESVMLGFINSKAELRALKQSLLRSNTRGVYKDDTDDAYVLEFPEIQRIANEIEAKRIELKKTSGFERQYHRVTKLYFGGIAKHLAELRPFLKPNARLAYVVGDQASYLRVMIRTGKLIAEIAKSLGYEVIKIDLFRTRFSTATKSNLNEEVVVLRWRG